MSFIDKFLDKKDGEENERINGIDENNKLSVSEYSKFELILSKFKPEVVLEKADENVEVEENTLKIEGVYAYDLGDKIEFGFYIKNGFNSPICFEDMPVSILNLNHKFIGHQVFDLREVGEVKPFESRLWKLQFDKENIFQNEILKDNWQILFDESKVIFLDVKVKLQDYQGVDVDNVNKFIENLPPLMTGKVDFSVYNIKLLESDEIELSLIVRNAGKKAKNINKISVLLKDDKGSEVLSGDFSLVNFEVGPLGAKVLNLKIPMAVIKFKDVDLSKLNVEVKEVL